MSTKRLLATDLDGTFIGDDEAMHLLWDALDAKGILVGFSTGRHLKSIQDFYGERNVTHRADVCICMVGTDIHFRESGTETAACGAVCGCRGATVGTGNAVATGNATVVDSGYRLDERWHEIIGQEWDKTTVEEILASIPEARMQDAEWQSPFKSSYFLEENVEQRLAEIHQRLKEAGLKAKVVYSAGKFLDLLPIRSGKGEAVRYVAEYLGLTPQNVITSGDTGNDLDMMRPELGFRGIAVGNAAEELKAFRAPHVYHAKAFYAAGIHEGLKVHGWL